MPEYPLEGRENVGISGFAGIKKVRGILLDIQLVDPPESWESKDKQAQVLMGDTHILEMFGDEEPFELTDGKFSFYIPYKLTQGGKIAPNSIYNKCWLDSCEEVYKDRNPSKHKGEYIVLEKQPRLLFQQYQTDTNEAGRKVPALNEQGEKIKVDVLAVNQQGRPNHFCFVADETADSDSVADYIRDLVVGLNQKAALRKLLIDQKAKQYPEYKVALNDGVLAELLGLVLVGTGDDAKFQIVSA